MGLTDRTAIVGVFRDEARAQKAREALQSAGFEQVQVLRSKRTGSSSGGLLTGLKRFLGGETTASTQQSIFTLLTENGIPDARAHFYEQEYHAGKPIVLVTVLDRQQEATTILRSNGASEVSTSALAAATESSSVTTQPPLESLPPTTEQAAETPPPPVQGAIESPHPTTQQSVEPLLSREELPVEEVALTPDRMAEEQRLGEVYDRQQMTMHEERLNATKEHVQSGEVEVHKEVVNEQKTLAVPVTHEEVIVERRPGSGAITDEISVGQGDEVIRVPVSEEKVQVKKAPLVTGEISVSKEAVQEIEHVTATTQHEEVHVEQEGEAPIHGTPSDPFHKPQAQKAAQETKPAARPRVRKKKR